MGSKKRTHFFWVDNEIIKQEINRPSGTGRWKEPSRKRENLILSLEGDLGEVTVVEKGPAFSNDRLLSCFEQHLNLDGGPGGAQLWEMIPDSIKRVIQKKTIDSVQRAVQQWGVTSNEETLSGVLFGAMVMERQADDWKVEVRYIEFSKISKEPQTGADLAIILSVKNDDGRISYKTIWLQAKKSNDIPHEILKLPRIKEQIENMKSYTSDYCVIIYTREDIVVAWGEEKLSLDLLIQDALSCRRGDSERKLLVDSVNRKHVLQVMLERVK